MTQEGRLFFFFLYSWLNVFIRINTSTYHDVTLNFQNYWGANWLEILSWCLAFIDIPIPNAKVHLTFLNDFIKKFIKQTTWCSHCNMESWFGFGNMRLYHYGEICIILWRIMLFQVRDALGLFNKTYLIECSEMVLKQHWAQIVFYCLG